VSRPTYLTRREVARARRISVMQVTRLVQAGQLPALIMRGTGLYRIEAQALDAEAPPAVPTGLPPLITIEWMAEHWRVHTRTITRLAHDGLLPLHLVSGRWGMARREWIAWVIDHTRGEDSP
jgi:excisionase family DNA binding protein